MNTINEQTATLTKLIAEIDELDSDKQCLAVELDYLIKHLQRYKQTCEECVAMKKTHEEEDEEKGATCAECGEHSDIEEDEEDEEEETPTCGFCGRDAGHSPIEHPKWDELYFCSEKCYKDYE
jgi:hypothetical protein